MITIVRSNEDRAKTICENLNKYINEETKIFIANDDYKKCCGCFGCWLKTPGKCVLKDSILEVTESYVKSNILICVTKLEYGCYEQRVKAVLERSLVPSLHPFFERYKGEMHHKKRYDKYPKFLVIGYGDNVTKDEEKTMNTIVKRNGLNIQNDAMFVLLEDCNNVENAYSVLKDMMGE